MADLDEIFDPAASRGKDGTLLDTPRGKAAAPEPASSDIALMAEAVKDLAEAVAARPVPKPAALKLTHPDGRVTVIERQEHQ